MLIRYLCIMSMLVCFTPQVVGQQVLVNKSWEESFGQPQLLDWSSSILDQQGNLLTTGNNYVSNTLTQLLLTKQDPSGSVIWQQTFSLSGSSNNYGVQICTDQASNIYVVGAAKVNSAAFYDMVFLKYDAGGNLIWSQTYDGGKEDAAIAVACTPDGSAIFVTGSSGAANTLPDFMTLRLDGNDGTIDWDERYNHTSNLYDVPVGISFNGSNLLVLGGSAPSISDVDFFGIKYDLSGNFIDSFRLSNPGFNFDQPASLAKDVSGNFYVTGSTSTTSNGTDVRTIKLNSTLDVVWNHTLDVAGGNDRAASVQVDVNGNVYVCGFATLTTGKQVTLIGKYDSNGSLLWNKSIGHADQKSGAIKGKLDALGNYTVIAQTLNGLNSFWQLSRFDSNGNLTWSTVVDGSVTATIEKPFDILIAENGDFVVFGVKEVVGVVTYTSIWFQYLYRNHIIINDSLGLPHHLKNEVLIRFKPNIVDTGFINNTNVRYTELGEVLPSAMLSALDAKLMTNGDIVRWNRAQLRSATKKNKE
jgi:hypothetical protein